MGFSPRGIRLKKADLCEFSPSGAKAPRFWLHMYGLKPVPFLPFRFFQRMIQMRLPCLPHCVPSLSCETDVRPLAAIAAGVQSTERIGQHGGCRFRPNRTVQRAGPTVCKMGFQRANSTLNRELNFLYGKHLSLSRLAL